MALEATSALGVAAGSKAAGLAALAATPGRSVGVQIAAGSYERLLFGLDLVHDSEAGYGLKPLFIYAPHTGCIKALASGDRFLASGSTDEVIRYKERVVGADGAEGEGGGRGRGRRPGGTEGGRGGRVHAEAGRAPAHWTDECTRRAFQAQRTLSSPSRAPCFQTSLPSFLHALLPALLAVRLARPAFKRSLPSFLRALLPALLAVLLARPAFSAPCRPSCAPCLQSSLPSFVHALLPALLAVLLARSAFSAPCRPSCPPPPAHLPAVPRLTHRTLRLSARARRLYDIRKRTELGTLLQHQGKAL